MQVVMRPREPYGERWPTKRELVGDVMGSRLLVGTCSLISGAGLGVTGTLLALGIEGAWKPASCAFLMAALLAGGIRFVLGSFYEQEVRPRSERGGRPHISRT